MRPVGYGRPGTEVIPTDWETTHAPVVATTFDCTITIGPATGGDPVFDDETGTTHSTPGTRVYDGPASLSPVTDTSRLLDAVDEQARVQRYEVLLTHDTAGIAADHILRVVTSPDPLLAGRTLTDLSVAGGRRFSRVVQATLAR